MKKVKLSLAAMALLLILSAKSQNNAKEVIAQMKQETANIEGALNRIDQNIQKDKHLEMDKEIHEVGNSLSKLLTQAATLPAEYKDKVVAKISSIKTNKDAFEKIVHKSKLFDKDKDLLTQYSQLKIKLGDLRGELINVDNELDKQQPVKVEPQAQPEQPQEKPQPPQPDNAKRNAALKSIRERSYDLQTNLTKITAAFSKDDFADVAHHSGEVAKICDRMMLFLGSMAEEEKETLSIAINLVKADALELEENAKKGKANHTDMHKHAEELNKDAETFKTQLNELK